MATAVSKDLRFRLRKRISCAATSMSPDNMCASFEILSGGANRRRQGLATELLQKAIVRRAKGKPGRGSAHQLDAPPAPATRSRRGSADLVASGPGLLILLLPGKAALE